jgi:hypothetical protein
MKCENCKFYDVKGLQDQHPATALEHVDSQGLCRRYPPIFHPHFERNAFGDEVLLGWFATVDSDGWCGEFSSKQKPLKTAETKRL